MKKAKRVLRAVSCVAFVLLVMLFYLFPEYFIFAIFGAASEFGSNSHRIVWNVLDDECFGKEIELNFWTPVSASRVETAKRTVTIGKTKRIRLPQKMYFMLDDAENPEDLCVFVPYESCWRENKDTGKREKSPHEIVVFAKPSVAEDEECFRINKSSARINSAVENARCSLLSSMDRSLAEMRHIVRIVFAVLEFGIVKTKCLCQGRRFDAPKSAVAF